MNGPDFSSLDRLLDFGLCMSMAQQMVNMMNTTMQTMQIPESAKPLSGKPSVDWFCAIDQKACGPYSESEIKQLLMNGQLNKDSLVWRSGMDKWQKIEFTPEILKLVLQLPPSL